MRAPLSIAIGTTQKIYVTKKAGEFLFEGFSDPLIDVATTIPGLAHQVPFDRFGWFYKVREMNYQTLSFILFVDH